jgi:hypothetical protein
VTLKKLPSGTYKISVLAITVLNQRLYGSRTYHSCTKSSGVIKLDFGTFWGLSGRSDLDDRAAPDWSGMLVRYGRTSE